MPTRLDGFYVARYEGLNADARFGFGVMYLRDGKVYGGDNLSCFLGEFEDHGNKIIARVKVYPLVEAYHSITGVDDKPWDLPDIRGDVPGGELPLNLAVELFGQRYDTHQSMTVKLQRVAI